MCGIGGFSQIKDDFTKLRLTYFLGQGIDTRGGHGIGYVAIKDHYVRWAKMAGEWKEAPKDFIIKSAIADSLLMHSRWATCGTPNEVKQAHPFTIKRKGKDVLYGVHNGIIWDAWGSAAAHRRKIDVDSQELLELIADRETKTLQKLAGYGVAMWVECDTNYINLVRLSGQSEICVAKVENNGLVWASTRDILDEALMRSGIKPIDYYDCEEVGRVYHLGKKGIVRSNLKGVRLLEPWARGWWQNEEDEELEEEDFEEIKKKGRSRKGSS